MYLFLNIVSMLFQCLPRSIALFFGRFIGLFFYYFIPIRRSIALINLRIAFPELDIKKREKILRNCYCHYGMVLVDFLLLPKVKRNQNTDIVYISPKSLDFFKQKPGGIIMSGHIGNWEYIGPSLGLNNINCAGVAQIQHNSASNTFFNGLRASKNVKIIPINAGSKVMVETIKNGQYLGLISDQNAGKRGTEVLFFDKLVSVPKGAGAFHLKTKSPILIGFCILTSSFNYNLSIHVLDIDGLPNKSDEAIKEINQRYSKLLEKAIKKNPHQYFWFHRKWNKRNYIN